MDQYHGMSDGNINISDIIEVIKTTDPGSIATLAMDNEQPYVEIIEQPAGKALRFRYECEGRSAGSIPGVNSTPENKTFPSIRIVGYKGRAMVVVSCVTKDLPHRPHPHNLVGKEVCKQGVCTIEIPTETMTVTFSNLGIQCVKKKDIEEALRVREELRVDPFRTGFDHRKQPTSIDLNAVRLCFQVFLEGSLKGKFNKPLPPIVSDPIFDKKAMSDLVICKLSHCSASVAGSMEMILLCEKVAKEDIQIRFFEEKDGHLLWEGFGDFQPTHVHKQTAIAFRTPSYRIQQVEQPVQVYIQLRRPSDGTTSEALPFQMLPLGTDDADSLRRKRQKFNNNPSTLVLRNIQAEAEKQAAYLPVHCNFNIIKAEPIERLSPYEKPVEDVGFSLQPIGTVGSHQPHNNTMQTLRPHVSPGRTSSPVYSTYNPSLAQQHLLPPYEPNIQLTQPLSTGMHIQPFSYAPAQTQIDQVDPLMINRIDSTNNQGKGLPLQNNDDTTAMILDMDNQQFGLDWDPLNSGDLAAFVTPLSENLSSGLSISDPLQIKPESTNVDEENNSVTDRITWINQELCTLNKIFKPNQGTDS